MLRVDAPRPAQLSILSAVRRYWRDRAAQVDPVSATREVLVITWEFLRDSTPAGQRQRYGDADYDWDYRVNTTSGAVGWRDRLLGAFHSAYQPTEPGLFREMLEALQQHTDLTFGDFTFLDLGSGKGRTLLMACDYPFRRILGVELLPSLDEIAKHNISLFKSDSQKSFALESICADATTFPFPDGPLVIYLFNPFPEAGLRRALENLRESLARSPRAAYVLYHNPQLEQIFVESAHFEKITGTHQYSIFRAVI